MKDEFADGDGHLNEHENVKKANDYEDVAEVDNSPSQNLVAN